MQQVVWRLLVPRETAPAPLELEQKLVLTPGSECAEGRRPGGPVVEAEQQGGVILELPLRDERPEIGQQLCDARPRNLLRKIEPVRSQIAGDIGRPGQVRLDAPAA